MAQAMESVRILMFTKVLSALELGYNTRRYRWHLEMSSPMNQVIMRTETLVFVPRIL